jgi:NitT/TauT family transport system substrate-binding protein
MITRRDLLRGITGTVGLLGWPSGHASGEPPPETTRLRLYHSPSVCVAPQYIVGDLLKAEGFSDIKYVKTTVAGISKVLTSGEVDISLQFVAPLVIRLDAGDPITVLGGVHPGCFELFGSDRVRVIRDLKGKTVAITELGQPAHVFLSSMLAHVGLDPNKDVTFAEHPAAEGKRLLAEGKVDAYLAFPPDPQELRAKKVGHVVVNSTVDRPWSQYFCCMVAGHRDYVRKNPVATKRFLRAIIKAADLCGTQPEQAAQRIVDAGFTPRYDYALQTLKEISYGRWREYDAEDTIRFYSLRLRESGFIKTTPNKILADGTDWRFFNELKRELKG